MCIDHFVAHPPKTTNPVQKNGIITNNNLLVLLIAVHIHSLSMCLCNNFTLIVYPI